MNDKREIEKQVNHQQETRVACKARMRVNRTASKTWVVSVFVEEHNNHVLIKSPEKVRYRSHRKLHLSETCTNLIVGLDGEGLALSIISRVCNVTSGSQEEIITPQQCSDHIRKIRKNNIGQECISII